MKKYNVIGIGNALLDLTFNVDDRFLHELGLIKGEMRLIDREKSLKILLLLKNLPHKISPGGSSSNTAAGVSYLGGKSAFIGKLGKDNYGEIYEKKTKEAGTIPFLLKHASESTGYALTLITPDFERTFAVYLGAAIHLSKEDIEELSIKDASILHLEGYQLGTEKLRDVVKKAAKIAKENNILISLDLSDAGLVKGNLKIFKEFIKEYVNIVFANESEAFAFTGKKDEDALLEIAKICDIAIVKIGEKGSLIRANNKTYKIPGYKTKVVNTNGAGDMYSAGILYGITNNLDFEKAGKIASYSASLVVGRPEARYGKELKEIIEMFLSNDYK
jgi:sugar/nucleoside kinase (ribokinase family)